MDDGELADRLGRNIRSLREMRGMTQEQISSLAGVPRATWGHLESGTANPTLAVLARVANALQVSMEELVAAPRASVRLYRKDELCTRARPGVLVRKLLPDPIPGMEFDRIELDARARLVGVPHTPGTREHLACETGEIILVAAGERWHLRAGDVVVFRGDQRHSYWNPVDETAVGYSVVVLAKP